MQSGAAGMDLGGLEYMIGVMSAHAKGKEIQVRRKTEDDRFFEDTNEPTWDWSNKHYRIKSESPKSTPFDYNSMPFPCVIRKPNFINAEALVLAKGINYIVISGIGIPNTIGYAELMGYEWRYIHSATFPNGTYQWKPCTKESLK